MNRYKTWYIDRKTCFELFDIKQFCIVKKKKYIRYDTKKKPTDNYDGKTHQRCNYYSLRSYARNRFAKGLNYCFFKIQYTLVTTMSDRITEETRKERIARVFVSRRPLYYRLFQIRLLRGVLCCTEYSRTVD